MPEATRPFSWRTLLALVLVPVLIAGGFLWGTWNAGDRLRQVERHSLDVEAENARLRRALDFQKRTEFNAKVARVIRRQTTTTAVRMRPERSRAITRIAGRSSSSAPCRARARWTASCRRWRRCSACPAG